MIRIETFLERLGLLTDIGAQAESTIDVQSKLPDMKDVNWNEIKALKQAQPRTYEALQGFLLALRDHYPSRYSEFKRRFPEIESHIPISISGKQIKLRRIAIARLARPA